MLAIIKTGGKQYIVKEQDTLRVEKLPSGARTDKTVVFDNVLLVSSEGTHTVGKPIVSNARVEATVIRDGKEKKVHIVKYKAKVRYRRNRGHRQPFTEVRIDKIAV